MVKIALKIDTRALSFHEGSMKSKSSFIRDYYMNKRIEPLFWLPNMLRKKDATY